MGFPGSSDDKESACNAWDLGLIPGFGRFPGEGNDKPLRYSWLENFMDRGAWPATIQRIVKFRHNLATNTLTFSSCSSCLLK